MAPPRRGSKLTGEQKKRIVQRQKQKNLARKAASQGASRRGGGDRLSVADQERIAAAQKLKNISDVSGGSPIGGFEEEVKKNINTNQLLLKVNDIYNTKKAKDIRKKADEMFAIIKQNPTLTDFQKNNIRAQIAFVKDNHARLGYSMNELMSAVGTNAFNQIVGRTGIDRDTAAKLTPDQQARVQDIMDTYGREAVFRPDGTIGARSPTFGEFVGDAARGAVNIFGNTLLPRLLTGGKGFNVQAPEFGFGDIPSGANQFLTGDFAQYASPINLSAGIGAFQQPRSAGAARALRNPAMTGNRQGGGRGPDLATDPATTDPATTTTPVFAYQPYALPVAYDYTGGPEQSYIGGGFTEDGKPIGPFRAANGGIANFKGYGY
jgi:hypothetical protein